MEISRCNSCQQAVFFDNIECVRCGSTLAYLPDRDAVCALTPGGDGLFRVHGDDPTGPAFRLCANYVQHGVCNWAIPAHEPDALCSSCRLTAVIPNLERPGNLAAWQRVEAAKRRLVRSLLVLGLPIIDRQQDPDCGLVFEWRSDEDELGGEMVMTGHDNGCIVLNLAEADDAAREQRRLALHEPYRTLLGHFRHESGHYYWDRLVANSAFLAPCRELFGDDTADYAATLAAHYQNGPPSDWSARHISAYAASHPWEDWAETWAHYLHIRETLESMSAVGMDVADSQPGSVVHGLCHARDSQALSPFDQMIDRWLALSLALNVMNRSLGQGDAYPFVLSPVVIEKLRFVDLVVNASGQSSPTNASGIVGQAA